MRTLAILAVLLAAPAAAQEFSPYTLTPADADAINARRPSDWFPIVQAGDVFLLDPLDLIHIPTLAGTTPGSTLDGVPVNWMYMEDLEPRGGGQR